MARVRPRVKPPVLRTTSRARLGSWTTQEYVASFLALGMAARAKGSCAPVSKRDSGAAWNVAPHSRVPVGLVVHRCPGNPQASSEAQS